MFGTTYLCYIKAPLDKGNTLFYMENQSASIGPGRSNSLFTRPRNSVGVESIGTGKLKSCTVVIPGNVIFISFSPELNL